MMPLEPHLVLVCYSSLHYQLLTNICTILQVDT